MKPYPFPNGREHPRHVRPKNKKLILFILFILLAVLSFARSGGGILNFKDPTVESGLPGQDGTVYRFSKGVHLHKCQDEQRQVEWLIRLSSGSQSAVQQIVKSK